MVLTMVGFSWEGITIALIASAFTEVAFSFIYLFIFFFFHAFLEECGYFLCTVA